jgi:SAM-dependent methyltransferase
VRHIGRAITWPVRRFFDPRFANVAVVQRQTLELVKELRGLVEADADASNEAAAVLGAGFSQVRDLIEDATGEADGGITARRRVSVGDLDRGTADLLNYAGSHRGFAAQAGLWFNPPVVLRYGARSVELDRTNERIVEVPYVLGAIGQVARGACILDVGSAESTVALSLACLGYDVTAIDPRGYPFTHPRLKVVRGSVEHLELGGQFDAVVSMSTVEHIGMDAYGQAPTERADLAAMARIRELTRPGGILVLTIPFGRATLSGAERRYDRPALDELLDGWEVDDLAFARQSRPTIWLVDERVVGDDVDCVALVTARRT